MRHQMKLFKEPFLRIKEKRKIIEVRLFDEKRQKVSIGDEIEFSLWINSMIKARDERVYPLEKIDKNVSQLSVLSIIDNPVEKILVKVIGLSRFKFFKDLYSSFHYSLFGHPHGTTLEEQIKDIMDCYSKEDEEKYGCLAIHIKLIE